MSISDIKKERKRFIIYILLCILFSFTYEQFSHGVISYYIKFSFFFPFVGLLETFIVKNQKLTIKTSSHNLFKASILTFTLGSILKGVLDIYGTTNRLIFVYLILGLILFLLSIITYFKKK